MFQTLKLQGLVRVAWYEWNLMCFKALIFINFVKYYYHFEHIYVVFYVVCDSSSIGIKRRKKGCKMDKEGKKGWMRQHWRPNPAALEERPKLTVALMPQHWRPNAAGLRKR